MWLSWMWLTIIWFDLQVGGLLAVCIELLVRFLRGFDLVVLFEFGLIFDLVTLVVFDCGDCGWLSDDCCWDFVLIAWIYLVSWVLLGFADMLCFMCLTASKYCLLDLFYCCLYQIFLVFDFTWLGLLIAALLVFVVYYFALIN